VALENVLHPVLEILAAQITEKRLRVITDIPGELPAIKADRDRLVQILLNILDNAVKFTPEEGTIMVAAQPGAEGYLTVRISDTGVGISKGEIPRLGERFYRVDKTRSRELGGTGLGLSIVKHLMMVHRGRMNIESAIGRGTTVSLDFPFFREAV
jgi:two-component system phosphate regulon sensor histidine kinase PhoR